MTTYRVMIMNHDQTEGLGPVTVDATDPQAAIEKVAADEGMTLAQFIAAGLTVHMAEAT